MFPFQNVLASLNLQQMSFIGLLLVIFFIMITRSRKKPETGMRGPLAMRYLVRHLTHVSYTHQGAEKEDMYPGLKYLQLRSPHEFSSALVLQGNGADYSCYEVIAELKPHKDGNEWEAFVAVELLEQASEFLFLLPNNKIGMRVTRCTELPRGKMVTPAMNLSREARRLMKKMGYRNSEEGATVTPIREADSA